MKKQQVILEIVLGVMVMVLIIMVLSSESFISPNYDAMVEVSQRAEDAFNAIRELKSNMGISYENHLSGMVGPEISEIMTTLGSKEAKITSTNPNFAAVIYKYIQQLELNPGDKIAISLTGSFPALNISAIIAAEACSLEPIIISSIGASTYGATNTDLTYPDIEKYLFDQGIIHHKSIFISPGGDNDLGTNIDSYTLKSIQERLVERGYSLLSEANLDENIRLRMIAYNESKALINVGGGYVTSSDTYINAYGHLSSLNYKNDGGKGIINEFLASGRDVIHILNIKDIAIENGLPIAPNQVMVGEGDVYKLQRYNNLYGIIILLLFIVGLIGGNIVKRNERAQIAYNAVKQTTVV